MRGWLNKYQRQKQVISRLTNENAKLRERIAVLEKENRLIKQQLEQALLQIEELQRIIFSKKKKSDKDNADQSDDNNNSNDSRKPRKQRHPSSYRRSIPQEKEVTDYQECQIENCPDCNSHLTQIKVVARYVEDILPLEEWYQALKRVAKQFITTGYCPNCQKRVTAQPLNKQTVSLGENVKQFVVFSNIVLRLSYAQIIDFLAGSVHFRMSDGEIANILEEQANQLKPEYARIWANIRGQPGAHYDETTWRVQTDSKTKGNYGWVMTGTDTPDTVFLLGKNRGRGNALKLKGADNDIQVGITDDYGGYQNAFKKRQLCWSHPHRKLRDLKDSAALPKNKQEHCQQTYQSFARLYEAVQTVAQEPFSKSKRNKAKKQLVQKFDEITIPHELDPVKLRKIKERLARQKNCYFTCLTEPGIPPDNNKAERALRHLVIKRKNCYGSKTEKGAEIMSILYSVVLSYWWKSKENFFTEYNRLLAGQ